MPRIPKAKAVKNIKIPPYRKPKVKKLVAEADRPTRMQQLKQLMYGAADRMASGTLDGREYGQHASKIKCWQNELTRLKKGV